jgi:DNA repair protein SbcC/Rad50
MLLAAQGNNAALLDVLRGAAPWQTKLAAAQALSDEASLKQAERELRGQDKRVYQWVKQQHSALLAQRNAQEQAHVLIAAAHALMLEAEVPVNRAVELDRAWSALKPESLSDEQRSSFAALSAQLADRARSHAEAAQQQARTAAQARADAAAAAAAEAEAAALAAQQEAAVRAAAQAERTATLAQQNERRAAAKDEQRAQRVAQATTVGDALAQAEAALAAGHLAQTHQHLAHIDSTLHGDDAPEALRSRLAALRASYAQLRGWQHWAGGRARDDLTAQAQALAAATSSADAASALPVKLSIAQRADLIHDLRERWKALDRSSGTSSRALWQHFDAALKTAYQPVAEHAAVQRKAREENLQARTKLLQALGAVVVDEPSPNFKVMAYALEQFQRDWRKLGPLEHSVPRENRAAVAEQLLRETDRLQAPLNAARAVAQQQRELLITRAQNLGSLAAQRSRDLASEVRNLQSEWQHQAQHQAQHLPLARAVENELWGRFKSTLDGLFSARDAAHQAREAEFKGFAAERVALIARLETAATEVPSEADAKRTLAQVDKAWQSCGPAPRSEAAALDQRFRGAREALVASLRLSQQRQWHAVCDALEAALQTGVAPSEPLLPSAWIQALAQRMAGSSSDNGTAESTLLQLEAAWDLPAPPELADARRDLRLQQLKSALEGKRSAAAPQTPAQLLAALIAQPALSAAQQARWALVLQALRARGPLG